MLPLSTLHFCYSGLLNCKPFKGTVRLVLPISYSWKPGAVLHIQKGKLLSTHSVGASERQVIPHAICDATSKGAGGGAESRAQASTLTPNHRSQEIQVQNCKVVWISHTIIPIVSRDWKHLSPARPVCPLHSGSTHAHWHSRIGAPGREAGSLWILWGF